MFTTDTERHTHSAIAADDIVYDVLISIFCLILCVFLFLFDFRHSVVLVCRDVTGLMFEGMYSY